MNAHFCLLSLPLSLFYFLLIFSSFSPQYVSSLSLSLSLSRVPEENKVEGERTVDQDLTAPGDMTDHLVGGIGVVCDCTLFFFSFVVAI